MLDRTGGYSLAFVVFAVLLAMGMLTVILLGAERTKQADKETLVWRAGSRLG